MIVWFSCSFVSRLFSLPTHLVRERDYSLVTPNLPEFLDLAPTAYPHQYLVHEGSHMVVTQANPLKKLAHMLMQVCVPVFSAQKLVCSLWGGGHSLWAYS